MQTVYARGVIKFSAVNPPNKLFRYTVGIISEAGMKAKALFIGALILASFYGISSAETASTLIQKTRLLSRDPSDSGRVRFSNAQILDFLNEAQRDAIGATLCIRKQYSFDTSSGTRYYAMPSDFIAIDRLVHDDQAFEEKSPAKLDKVSTEWETVTGEPINFFVRFSSRGMVGFYPYPVTNTSTATVSVDYFAQPTDMETTSTPFNSIPEFYPFHQMLSYYAAAQMNYVDGLISSGDRYMQRYGVYLKTYGEFCNNRPTYLPGVNVAPGK